jgi:hypothetical protein
MILVKNSNHCIIHFTLEILFGSTGAIRNMKILFKTIKKTCRSYDFSHQEYGAVFRKMQKNI